MRKAAILINDTTYTYNLRKEIIDCLLYNDYSVIIVGQSLKYVKELQDIGCKIINIDISRRGKNPCSDILLFIKYMYILRNEKPDIALTYNIKPNVYGGVACNFLNIPYIANITGLGTAVENGGVLQKITVNLYKLGLSAASSVMFQNKDNYIFASKFHMIKNETRTCVIPGSGVSLTKYRLLKYPYDEVIKFVFISRILKEKGIDIYLETAKKIRLIYPKTEFHIIGYCDDNKYIEILKEAEARGDIIYHGEQKNINEYLKNIHCVVHPSYYPEGMSNVLLEAAASGRPIITTNRAGCKEIVDDAITGYCVETKDQYAVEMAVKKFIELPLGEKEKMGILGRKKVEDEFDRQLVVEAYMKEINRLVEY